MKKREISKNKRKVNSILLDSLLLNIGPYSKFWLVLYVPVRDILLHFC